MGRCASDLPLFRASIRVLTPRGNSQSQKSCNFGRISVFGHPDRPHAGAIGGGPGRGAFVDDFGQRCGRGGLGSAVRGCLWWRNVGGWMPWTTRRREWSGPGVTPLVALETLRVGAWSGAAGRHKKCLRLLASVREGKSICWAAYWRFASPWSRAFSLAASVGALTLIPPQRQLYCGIMIRTISKEL